MTNFGKIVVYANDNAVTRVDFTDGFVKYRPNSVTQAAIAEVREYFKGDRKEFTVPLQLEGSEFQKLVWQALCDIPYGETRTYKEIAAAIGRPNSSRAVGTACNKNKILFMVPCHRVIGAAGGLTGFAAGTELKTALLKAEASPIDFRRFGKQYSYNIKTPDSRDDYLSSEEINRLLDNEAEASATADTVPEEVVDNTVNEVKDTDKTDKSESVVTTAEEAAPTTDTELPKNGKTEETVSNILDSEKNENDEVIVPNTVESSKEQQEKALPIKNSDKNGVEPRKKSGKKKKPFKKAIASEKKFSDDNGTENAKPEVIADKADKAKSVPNKSEDKKQLTDETGASLTDVSEPAVQSDNSENPIEVSEPQANDESNAPSAVSDDTENEVSENTSATEKSTESIVDTSDPGHDNSSIVPEQSDSEASDKASDNSEKPVKEVKKKRKPYRRKPKSTAENAASDSSAAPTDTQQSEKPDKPVDKSVSVESTDSTSETVGSAVNTTAEPDKSAVEVKKKRRPTRRRPKNTAEGIARKSYSVKKRSASPTASSDTENS
jgi:methylated-DNA-[protein]-cysteine S-methyltransferase